MKIYEGQILKRKQKDFGIVKVDKTNITNEIFKEPMVQLSDDKGRYFILEEQVNIYFEDITPKDT